MAIFINHRINTLELLKQTPKEYGVEIDIRNYADRLILHHNPFVDGIDLNDFLKHYKHKLLVLNIKTEGIEEMVLSLVRKYKIKDYFLLDVTMPFIIKLINKGERAIAIRFSEFESIDTCMNFVGKIDWIFIDNLTHLPVENDSFKKLRKYFKLCIVSPEILGRNEIEQTKKLVLLNPVDAILTDNINEWNKK